MARDLHQAPGKGHARAGRVTVAAAVSSGGEGGPGPRPSNSRGEVDQSAGSVAEAVGLTVEKRGRVHLGGGNVKRAALLLDDQFYETGGHGTDG